MAVRLSDIAKRAGVSFPTVSAVVNRSKSTIIVSGDTRKRILKIAKEMGYVPHAAASALAKGQTHTIGILCHHLTDPNLLKAIARAEELCRSYDCNIQISTVQNSPDWLSLLRRGQVDILISLGIQMLRESHLEVPAELFPRIVVIGPSPLPHELQDHPRQWKLQVCWDDSEMGKRGGEHLIQLGHRRVGILEGRENYSSDTHNRILHARVLQVKNTIEAAGGKVEIINCKDELDMNVAGQIMTEQLLEKFPDVTAIFMRNDLFYPGVLAALNQAGRRGPQDISLFGCMGFYSNVTGMKSPLLNGVDRVLVPYLRDGQLPADDIVLTPEFNPGMTCSVLKK